MHSVYQHSMTACNDYTLIQCAIVIHYLILCYVGEPQKLGVDFPKYQRKVNTNYNEDYDRKCEGETTRQSHVPPFTRVACMQNNTKQSFFDLLSICARLRAVRRSKNFSGC